MPKPKVLTSTTSPVVIVPRCQSSTAQASSNAVSVAVTRACNRRSFSKIEEAAPPRRAFAADRFVEAAMLVAEAAESTHQRQVGDHIDHLAIGRGGAIGEIAMKRRAARREIGRGPRSSPPATAVIAAVICRLTVARKAIAPDGRDARRQHVPDEHGLNGIDRVGGRGDAAGQSPRHAVGEIARRVAGQMAEEIAAQIGGDAQRKCNWRSQPASRQQELSPAISATSSAKAPQIAALSAGPTSASTRDFSPYCAPTEQPTAISTAAKIAAWASARRRMISPEKSERPVGIDGQFFASLFGFIRSLLRIMRLAHGSTAALRVDAMPLRDRMPSPARRSLSAKLDAATNCNAIASTRIAPQRCRAFSP